MSNDTSEVDTGDLIDEFRREQDRTREELAEYIEAIRNENRQKATLGGGPCDLREHLNNPMEDHR